MIAVPATNNVKQMSKNCRQKKGRRYDERRCNENVIKITKGEKVDTNFHWPELPWSTVVRAVGNTKMLCLHSSLLSLSRASTVAWYNYDWTSLVYRCLSFPYPSQSLLETLRLSTRCRHVFTACTFYKKLSQKYPNWIFRKNHCETPWKYWKDKICSEPTKEGKGRKKQETVGGGKDDDDYFVSKILMPNDDD